jgi:hypothetical protein
MLRVDRLPEAAQQVLRLLAVGQRLDHRLLAEASGLDAGELRQALRESVVGHIVAPAEDGTYAFRHALLREVVHDDLLPGEDAEMHAALAAVLERRIEEDGEGAHLTAAAAHHHQAAGDRPAALAAAIRAAAAADRVHAHGETLALLERALELWSGSRTLRRWRGSTTSSCSCAPRGPRTATRIPSGPRRSSSSACARSTRRPSRTGPPRCWTGSPAPSAGRAGASRRS